MRNKRIERKLKYEMEIMYEGQAACQCQAVGAIESRRLEAAEVEVRQFNIFNYSLI